MKRKGLSLLLALALVLSLLPGAARAEEPEAQAAETSGYCGANGGTNLRWSLDSSGTLTISGSGNMQDFLNRSTGLVTYVPWREGCVTAVVEEGVTSVGEFAFFQCPNLMRVELADSVRSVGFKAFYLSPDLEEVSLGGGVTTIGEQAFCECRALQAVRLPESLTSIESGAFWNCVSLTEVVIPEIGRASCRERV